MAVAAESLGRPPVRVVLLGAPGSGKGTQAARLAAQLGVPVVSTGEMLRTAVAARNELGRRVEGVMATGGLVDDDLMGELVRQRLAQSDTRHGFLLDGYPRTPAQAATLQEILGGDAIDAVVLLDVPEETLVRRALGRQRADDREDIVLERLRVYRSATEPLVEHYRRHGLLRRIDGGRAVGQVTSDVLRALETEG